MALPTTEVTRGAPLAKTTRRQQMSQLVTVILGVWLFISAFAWRHSAAQESNSWIVAVLVLICSAVALYAPKALYLNTILGAWLFITAFIFSPGRMATVWNNALLGFAIIAASLLASRGEPLLRRLRRPEPV